MTFPAQFNLSDLNGDNGFIIDGIDARGTFGRSVSGAGDINGDGFDDLIVGSPDAGPSNTSYSGESYVVFGSDQRFATLLNLSDIDGSNGFALTSRNGLDGSDGSVSSAGDINGDGFDDLIIGSDLVSLNSRGAIRESYVVFGSTQGFGNRLNLSSLDGRNGFDLNAINRFDQTGYSVSGAGDINGDGIDDVIIGAPDADPNGITVAGESYVVFGSPQGFAASLNLADLDGRNGFILNGIDRADFSGRSVSSAGDINGDGFDDLIIGAYGADPNDNDSAGESYVVFGSDQDFAASLELADLNGTNGFVINGIDEDDRSGRSVSGAGDINGDGIDDLIIGANYADPNGTGNAGESYVVFGSDQGFDPSLELADLDGTNGFVINGIDERDYAGRSVSSAGDINGDGFDDLIIGADLAFSDAAGASYVVFGGDQGFAASLELADLDGTNGFVIRGFSRSDASGRWVSDAGDVNGDGIDDLIIGARYANTTGDRNVGASYVVFGRRTPTPDNDVLPGTTERDVIFALAGDDRVSGRSGNDRLAGQEGNDRLIGGEGQDNLLGGSGQDVLLGGADDDRLLGGTDDDQLNGNGGNDRLLGGAGIDTLRGDAGADTLVGGAANDILLGGGGNDRLLGSAGNDTLNGQSGNDILRDGSGNDVLQGGGGNDRLVGSAGDDTLDGQSGNDILQGGNGNDVLQGGDGNDRLRGDQGNDVITTGAGSDRIFIRAGQGFDRVTDFSNGPDLIILGGIRFEQLSIQQLNNNVLISLGDERLLRLNNTQVETISAANFV